LSATATGLLPMSPQWYFNGAGLFNATGFSLTLPQVTLGQAGTYQLVVNNNLGAVTSAPAVLTVVAADTAVGIWLAGPTGQVYRVDSTTNMTAGASWVAAPQIMITNGPIRLDGPPWTNGPAKFYRPVPGP
jgi:hypothetical protein